MSVKGRKREMENDQQGKCTKLKLARISRGLSQEQLAESVGVVRQTIGLIETGKYNPSLNLCLALCRALGKTLDELFWEN